MAYSVQQVIDRILQEIPGAPKEDTVDTIKAGNGAMPVKGIVTTFIATMDVLRKTVDQGANLIITHEPTYYNHRDEVEWLAQDPVYAAKRKFIEEHGLAIWRFHDHWHEHRPDGIVAGLVQKLGWAAYQDRENEKYFQIPATTLGKLEAFLKEKLGMPQIRVVGPADMAVRRVVISVGSYYGEWQIKSMNEAQADVLVVGETSEWQVYEYIRDANAAGLPRGLLIIGHERSEEPGMAYLAAWLKERFLGLPVTHIAAGDPLAIR